MNADLVLIVFIPRRGKRMQFFLFTTRSVPHLRLRGLREIFFRVLEVFNFVLRFKL